MWKYISNLTVDPLTVDCWSSPPRINSQQCWSSITSLLTINCLTVDCWSLITSLLIVNPLTVDCWSLIASLLTIDPLTVDCWSSITSLLTINPLTVDCWSSIASLLTVDPLTVDPPQTLYFRRFCDFPCDFVENNEISVPPRHSVRSTGWPLVFVKNSINVHAYSRHFIWNLQPNSYPWFAYF